MATSVYVHFPWCLQKCPYCDFASASIKRGDVPHARYADAVLAELAMRAPLVAGQELASVFFGGGTPSLWEPAQLGRVLSAIRGSFASEAPELEITAECNPSSLDRERARGLREVGVNRLSIGVQSLNETQLRFLGRLHDARGALRAVEDALAEVPRVSGDLIFGLPEQPLTEAVAHAQTLVALGLSHVSIYSLTIEPDTQFGALHKKGRLPIAREDDVADTYLAIEAALGAEGFAHYEVSNYAKPGQSSRHNQHYWRGGSYLGLGAGAVGCLRDGPQSARRYRNDAKVERYLEASASSTVEVFEEKLGPDELLCEQLLLGLRTEEGASLARLAALDDGRTLEARKPRIARGVARGELVQVEDTLRVPHERWLALDSIVSALF